MGRIGRVGGKQSGGCWEVERPYLEPTHSPFVKLLIRNQIPPKSNINVEMTSCLARSKVHKNYLS